MSDRPPHVWGQPDDERLYAVERDEAIESILDGFYGMEAPRTIQVQGFAPMEFDSSPLESRLIEWIDEYLYENAYSDPDGDPWSMDSKGAAQALSEAIKAAFADYVPWGCEPVTPIETVDCVAWVAEHRPDWEVTWEPLATETEKA